MNNYASTSNNNLFFGTSGVYSNGTAFAFGPFQTLVGTRETASKSQNPTFASTTGADANYLNFANGAINLAGGNAQVIAGYTTDYSGATRDASAPDMGAYEFAQGTISAPTITGFTTAFSPSAPIFLCAAGGSVVTITGTGLDTVSSVLFNGPSGVTLVGTITGQTATSLTVTSPAGVVDGIIRVTNPAGSADSGSSFTTADAPTVGVSSAVTICSGSSTTLTATGASTYAWSPSTGLSATTGASVTANPTVNTTYTVTVTVATGCETTREVTVSVNEDFLVEVPNLFTPNGDGINDYFIIDNIFTYDAEVLIFNRWGTELYSSTAYQNDWDGTNNDGDPLTDGTYYYVVKVGPKVYKGAITILR